MIGAIATGYVSFAFSVTGASALLGRRDKLVGLLLLGCAYGLARATAHLAG